MERQRPSGTRVRTVVAASQNPIILEVRGSTTQPDLRLIAFVRKASTCLLMEFFRMLELSCLGT